MARQRIKFPYKNVKDQVDYVKKVPDVYKYQPKMLEINVFVVRIERILAKRLTGHRCLRLGRDVRTFNHRNAIEKKIQAGKRERKTKRENICYII